MQRTARVAVCEDQGVGHYPLRPQPLGLRCWAWPPCGPCGLVRFLARRGQRSCQRGFGPRRPPAHIRAGSGTAPLPSRQSTAYLAPRWWPRCVGPAHLQWRRCRALSSHWLELAHKESLIRLTACVVNHEINRTSGRPSLLDSEKSLASKVQPKKWTPIQPLGCFSWRDMT